VAATPFAHYLLQSSAPADARPTACGLGIGQAQAGMLRRGWRPASARREAVGGGARTSHHGLLRTDAMHSPRLAQYDLSPRAPQARRVRAPPKVRVAPSLTRVAPSDHDEVQCSQVASQARERAEEVLFASAGLPGDEQIAPDVRAVCEYALGEYERELQVALRECVAAQTRLAATRVGVPAHAQLHTLSLESTTAVLRQHLDAWRQRIEQSGTLLQAALVAQRFESEDDGSEMRASLRALLDNEAEWVIEQSQKVMVAARLGAELHVRMRPALPLTTPSGLQAAIKQVDLHRMVSCAAHMHAIDSKPRILGWVHAPTPSARLSNNHFRTVLAGSFGCQ
jgi:hypothetical protein